ncbi:MAG: hypothetical protein ABIJ46_01560 [bacterium]
MPREDWESIGDSKGTRFFRKKDEELGPNFRAGLETTRTEVELELILSSEVMRELPEEEQNIIHKQADERSVSSWQSTGFDGGCYSSVGDCTRDILKERGLIRLPE